MNVHAPEPTLNLKTRVLRAATLTGHFTLRSGEVASTYFDKYLFESDPVLLRAIAERMAELVPPQTEILAGLEMGGIPVVTALSQVTGLPAAFIRKAPKTYGTCKFAEGPDLPGRNVVLVEDVVSSGGSLLDAVARLRADGTDPQVALCVLDRARGGLAALKAARVDLRAVFTVNRNEGRVRPHGQ